MGAIVSDMPCCAGQAEDISTESTVPYRPPPPTQDNLPARAPAAATQHRQERPAAQAPPSPQSPITSGGGGGSSANDVRQLTEMGFSEAQARDALASCNGNLESATAMLLSEAASAAPPSGGGGFGGSVGGGGDDPKVKQIQEMGFTVKQAQDALDGAGGDVDRALNYLLSQ
eukprot:TRINITY_DN16418_c0_g1_i1.p1 TRINITY_DN16418_c0_g1~~TRINITY_DN16418_c0_g1_i1.p1  ORF type:complete len:172 (+),score=46.55 TRINITY_DN16418_c0_g1_i1:99-614(+)